MCRAKHTIEGAFDSLNIGSLDSKSLNTGDKQTQVLSPCRSLCNLNTLAICEGCFRTSSEISFWASMSNEEKLEVIKNATQRERGEEID